MLVFPSPHGDQEPNASGTAFVRKAGYHLTVCKKYLRPPGTSSGVSESSPQPVIPPAPLTGDVGRDCGDASRALLFVLNTLGRAATLGGLSGFLFLLDQ